MQCGASSCRHELQQRLAALNPGLAERVAALSTAAAAAPDSGGGSGSSGIRSRGAWERALQAGTAGDARKVASREAAEKVGWSCLVCVVRPGVALAWMSHSTRTHARLDTHVCKLTQALTPHTHTHTPGHTRRDTHTHTHTGPAAAPRW
jgi:hypothetical protein